LYHPLDTSLAIPSGAPPTYGVALNPIGLAPIPWNLLQCSGFSNLMSNIGPYMRYRVLASKIDFKLNPIFTSGGRTDAMRVVVIPWRSNDANGPLAGNTLYSTIQSIGQAQYSKTRDLGVNTSGRVYGIKHYATTAQVYGVPRSEASLNNLYTAKWNTTPFNTWCWLVYMNTLDAQGLVANPTYTVTLKYYAMLDNYSAAGILDQ